MYARWSLLLEIRSFNASTFTKILKYLRGIMGHFSYFRVLVQLQPFFIINNICADLFVIHDLSRTF